MSHKGYTREAWRELQGFDPNEVLPRTWTRRLYLDVVKESIEDTIRNEEDIRSDLQDQLEQMFASWPDWVRKPSAIPRKPLLTLPRPRVNIRVQFDESEQSRREKKDAHIETGVKDT